MSTSWQEPPWRVGPRHWQPVNNKIEDQLLRHVSSSKLSRSFQQTTAAPSVTGKSDSNCSLSRKLPNIILTGRLWLYLDHLKHFLLLESLSLLTALPGLLHLHTAGVSLRRIWIKIMECKFHVIIQVVTSALLSLNSLTVFQEYYNCIITVTTEMNNMSRCLPGQPTSWTWPSQPSSCGWTPWGPSCSWTHYP